MTRDRSGPRLLMIAPAPVEPLGGGRLRLDGKFVDGMRLHQELWRGPVDCILWRGGGLPFGQEVAEGDLGFGLTVLNPGAPVTARHLAGSAVVAASADMHETLDLARPCREVGAKLCYVLEYTLGARLTIVRLDRDRSALQRLRSAVWHLRQDRRRRAAIRAADALQVNGYPAEQAYARLSRDCLLYLDGRLRRDMLATSDALARRAARLRRGDPLRIVHSGRLEPLKGAQDLLPVARGLRRRGVGFTLDVFGTGRLSAEIAAGIAAEGLSSHVRLHDPLPFQAGLVPWVTENADLFLSCHRQADPSCTYLETMGCGVPVIGYDNAMWRRMAAEAGAGWVRPMGRPDALAEGIAAIAADRGALIAAADRALAFARQYVFEAEFRKRMDHLARLVATA